MKTGMDCHTWGIFKTASSPYLAKLRGRLYDETYTSDDIVAGKLKSKNGQLNGLTTDTVIAVGTFDAHSGAVGAKSKESFGSYGNFNLWLSCCFRRSSWIKIVRGICGQVNGSVIPGYMGLNQSIDF
jgi:L-ribulokinase